MEYKNDKLGASFEIPDKLSIRRQLAYKSVIAYLGKDEASFYARLWEAAEHIVDNWKCDAIKPGDDLDEVTDPAAVKVIQWAGMRAYDHMDKLESVPKN